MNHTTIGIDISKDHLDVHRLGDGATRSFANARTGHNALIRWLATTPVSRIVYEPTGPYHRAVEAALDAAGLPLASVNPRQARRFAEATGKRAKTDRCDAAMLARMGEALSLPTRPLASQTVRKLKELHAARHALVKNRTAARNRAKILSITLLKRQNAACLAQIDRQLVAIDKAITAIIAHDDDLAVRLQILVSIPGISAITAQALIVDMPELGTLDNKQAASLAGLAPITRQSGTWRGRAFIRGGRANVRRALYMPTLSACRFNPDLKSKYESLVSAGKPAKVAITAIMRKLIILANALLRDNRKWAPTIA